MQAIGLHGIPVGNGQSHRVAIAAPGFVCFHPQATGMNSKGTPGMQNSLPNLGSRGFP